jgi:hypothetical protein
MTEISRKEREERAFEALIVSQLRRECDPEKGNVAKLSDAEKAAIDELGPDLIDRLWNGEVPAASAEPEKQELVMSGADDFGMNRAENISEETAAELNRRRAEILQRLKKLREEKKNG